MCSRDILKKRNGCPEINFKFFLFYRISLPTFSKPDSHARFWKNTSLTRVLLWNGYKHRGVQIEFSLCRNSAEVIDHVWDGDIIHLWVQGLTSREDCENIGPWRPCRKLREDNGLPTGQEKGAQNICQDQSWQMLSLKGQRVHLLGLWNSHMVLCTALCPWLGRPMWL